VEAVEGGRGRIFAESSYHAFRNVGTTIGRLLSITNSGGLDEYFLAISSLELPQDTERLAEISKHYGYVFSGPKPGRQMKSETQLES
jgi:hypothetical protein